MWAFEARDSHGLCPWVQSRPEVLVRHLKNCQYQPSNIHDLSTSTCIEKGWNCGPGPGWPSSSQQSQQLDTAALYRFPSEPIQVRSARPSISLNSPPRSQVTLGDLSLAPETFESKAFLFSQSTSGSPVGTPPILIPLSGSPTSFPFMHSISGSPLLSDATDLHPSSKRHRVSSHQLSQSAGFYSGGPMPVVMPVRSAAYQD